MYKIKVQDKFSAAHRLLGYRGPCEALHGHNFKVEVVIRANKLDKLGMVIDFKKIKKILERIIDPYDHVVLNEVPPFDRINPTSENIAKVIADHFSKKLARKSGLYVDKVTIWEAEGSSAEYIPDSD